MIASVAAGQSIACHLTYVVNSRTKTFRTAKCAEVIGGGIDGTVWSCTKGVEEVEVCAAARGSRAGHLAPIIDTRRHALRSPESAEVIGGRIDGTIWSRAKCVEDCVVAARERIADHLAQIIDTRRLAFRTAKCAEIVDGGIDGVVRLCTKGMQWGTICDCGRPGHLAQVVNTLGVTLHTAERTEIIGGVDRTVGRCAKGKVTVVPAGQACACHLALGVDGVAETYGTAERAEVGYEILDLGVKGRSDTYEQQRDQRPDSVQ